MGGRRPQLWNIETIQNLLYTMFTRMKTSTTTRINLFFSLLVFFFTASVGSAQSLQRETNWLQAWKNFAGSQTSATWLSEEIANGATLYRETESGALVLKSSADWNSISEMENALEEGIQEGNGNQLLAAGVSEGLGYTAAVNSWKGLLGGRQVYTTVIAQLQDNANSALVMRISLTPIHQELVVRKESAITLLGQLGMDGMTSPFVSETK